MTWFSFSLLMAEIMCHVVSCMLPIFLMRCLQPQTWIHIFSDKVLIHTTDKYNRWPHMISSLPGSSVFYTANPLNGLQNCFLSGHVCKCAKLSLSYSQSFCCFLSAFVFCTIILCYDSMHLIFSIMVLLNWIKQYIAQMYFWFTT